MTDPNVVLIGGGSGSFTLLQELKIWTLNITAIVNMSDSGGSTGALRDELGVLPPGDIRQCLVALSNTPETRDLFNYRFGEGKLSSHAVGNIILSALELQTGSFIEAVRIASEFLKITGKVVPVVNEKQTLLLKDGDSIIRGEHRIKDHKIAHRDALVSLEPIAKLNPDAIKAIQAADMVIIAPGDLYASLLPVLAVKGMSTALITTKARLVMVANLVNKPRQTFGWHVVDYVNEAERYIGPDAIDYVVYNTKQPDIELLKKYAKDKEFPVDIELSKFDGIRARAIGAPLVNDKPLKQNPADTLIKRSLIRHDALALRKQLENILLY